MSGNQGAAAPQAGLISTSGGYRSEEDRRRYTFKAAILAVVFGAAQFVIPFAIMLVAFTDKWQRLGDMVAKTIVIRCRVARQAARQLRGD